MSCCKLYTMGISAFSTVFLSYLAILVGTKSESLYIQIHDPMSSCVALFISALIYAGICCYLYYDIFLSLSRKDKLKLWISQRKKDIQMEELEMNKRRHRELSSMQ